VSIGLIMRSLGLDLKATISDFMPL